MSLERFELARDGDRWFLRGTVVAMDDGEPTDAIYGIACDSHWRTLRASVTLRSATLERSLELVVEGAAGT